MAQVFNTFAPNWRRPIQVETAYLTDITASAETLAEERRSLWGSPNRTMRNLLTGASQQHVHALLMRLARHANEQIYVPLYPDQTTVVDTDDDDTIFCDTTNRRFYVGFKIIVLKVVSGVVIQETLLTIASLDDTSITVEEADEIDNISDQDLVFPAMLIEPSISQSGQLLTDHVMETEFGMSEVIGPTSIPASETTFPPPGFATYLGLPILNADPNWSPRIGVGISRGGNKHLSGRGIITEFAGRRPQFNYPLQFIAPDRSVYWDHLRFFDSIRGRRKPFWMIAPQTMFVATEFGTDFVKIQPSGSIDDITELLDYIGLQLQDDSIVIRRIESVEVDGDFWKIFVTTNFDSVYSLSQVKRTTSAHLIRSSVDFLRETWHTNTVATLEFDLFEILEEETVEVENVNPGFEFGWPATIPDLLFWFSAHSNCYYDEDKPADLADLKMDGLAEVESEDFENVSIITDVREEAFNFSSPYLAAVGSVLPPLIWMMTAGTADGRRALTARSTGISGDFVDRLDFAKNQAPYTDDFFSNTNGLTIFAVWRFREGTTFNSRIFWKDAVVQWDCAAARVFETTSGPSSDITGLDAFLKDKAVHVMALHWTPGSFQKIYIDGREKGTASGSIVTTIPSAAYAPHIRLQDQIGPPGSGNEQNDDKCFEILGFPRALTVEELNIVGSGLADQYDVSWKQIP